MKQYTFSEAVAYCLLHEKELMKTDFGKKILYLIKTKQMEKLKKAWLGMTLGFIVSWTSGVVYQKTDCQAKEPKEIICAKPTEQKTEKPFKTEEAATEFAKVLTDSKVANVQVRKP